MAFLNGQFIKEENAFLHISDLAIQRGYGIFDYCRTSNDIPVYLDYHIDRFFRSAELMHLQLPIAKPEIISIIQQLISKNVIPNSGIRMLLTGGYSPDSYEVVRPNLVILQHPLHLRPAGLFEQGIKVITHEYVREFPGAKTINYSMGIWLQQKIKESNAVDVLYHQQGEVSEFPRSNFFIVTKDDVVATPKKNILQGITRKKIIELASNHFVVEERIVTLHDIRTAKEAFMTSTTKRILPIVQVDNAVIGNGQPGQIAALLDKILEKEESVLLQ
ncbi:MAG: aminotransferase class IV [Chitinophagaceae bacterium]|nr:aminotransferase class IV [Chitinophagaceae bacterium]